MRQIGYAAAPDLRRSLPEFEALDPLVLPQALGKIAMSGDRTAALPLIVRAGAGEAEYRPAFVNFKAIEWLDRLRGPHEPDAVPELRHLDVLHF